MSRVARRPAARGHRRGVGGATAWPWRCCRSSACSAARSSGCAWPRCWPQGISNTNTRVIVSVAVVVLLVVLGETTGVFLGRRVRDRITGERSWPSTRRSARSCRRSRWSWPPGWSRCRWPRRACPAIAAGVRGSRGAARGRLGDADGGQAAPGRAAPAAGQLRLPRRAEPVRRAPPSPPSGRRTPRSGSSPAVAGRAAQRAEGPRQGAVVPAAAGGIGLRLRARSW